MAIVKFDLSLRIDPDRRDVETGRRGYATYNRDGGYRAIAMPRDQAEVIYKRVQDYLELQMGAFLPKEGSTHGKSVN